MKRRHHCDLRTLSRRRHGRRRRRRWGEGGQALLEYAIISYFLILTVGGLAFVGLPKLLEVYQEYIGSFFFVLNSPFP